MRERLARRTRLEVVAALGAPVCTGVLLAEQPALLALSLGFLATAGGWWGLGWARRSYPQGATWYRQIQPQTAEQHELQRLGGLLQVAEADLAQTNRRLHRVEAAAIEHTRLLTDLGALVVPRLDRAQRELAALLDQPHPTQRRGLGGDIQATVQECRHLVESLLALGRAESTPAAPRPERLDLRTGAAQVLAERGELEIDEDVPSLVHCDRALFATVLEQLICHAESVAARPRFELSSIPQRADTVMLTLRFRGGVPASDRARIAVAEGDSLRLAALLLDQSGGEASLGLALALCAMVRLGGRAAIDANGAEPILTVEWPMPVAIDRRASSRSWTLDELTGSHCARA